MVFPKDMWAKMGDMGFLGMTASEEFGGMDLGYFEHCLVVEELSKANAGLALSYLAHSNLCVNQINLNASQAQKEKYLPKLIAGEWVGSLAMSEPNSGSDVTSMQLKAEKKGDKYILNGSKMWITNGPSADVIVVYAKTDMSAGHKGISTFIIEKDMPGFSIAQKLDKLGMRGSETGELVFEDCEVPAENLMGQEGQGVYIMMKGLDYERLILAAGALGIHQRAVDESLGYCADRKQFNKALIDMEIIQLKLADMYCNLQATRSMIYQSAEMFDNGVPSNLDSASVFLQASRSAVHAADECI